MCNFILNSYWNFCSYKVKIEIKKKKNSKENCYIRKWPENVVYKLTNTISLNNILGSLFYSRCLHNISRALHTKCFMKIPFLSPIFFACFAKEYNEWSTNSNSDACNQSGSEFVWYVLSWVTFWKQVIFFSSTGKQFCHRTTFPIYL